MACPQCAKDPFAHSFTYFGKTAKDVSLYYTAPARATAREDNYTIQSLRTHLQDIQGPWVWVLDCTNMELHHMYSMRFSAVFADILAHEHSKHLKHILILHPNGWIRRILFGLPENMFQHITFCAKGMELSKASSDFEFPSSAKMWLQIAMLRNPNEYLEEVKRI